MIAEAHCENQPCRIIHKELGEKRELGSLLLTQYLGYSQLFFPFQTNYYLVCNYYYNYYLVVFRIVLRFFSIDYGRKRKYLFF